jgi:hypothetical protein
MYTAYQSVLFFLCLILACNSQPAPFPTEEQIDNAGEISEIPPTYQTLYSAQGLPKPTEEGQRLRALIWIQRMNLTKEQLDRLSSAYQMAQTRHQQLLDMEEKKALEIQQQEDPIYTKIWELIKTGSNMESDEIKTLVAELHAIREENPRTDIITNRIEGVQSILQAQQNFLSTLTPEQEQVIVDALFFLRHKLDPVANPEDFSILIGNIYNPGQFAVLTKGTSKVARQSMNIGGLWTDEPVLTGRELHEARREAVLYLALLEPALEEAIDVARSLL